MQARTRYWNYQRLNCRHPNYRGSKYLRPEMAVERRPSDSGMATIWAVGVIVVLLLLATGLLWFGAAVMARHKATAAADLAALATASRAEEGEGLACDQALWISRQMSVHLVSCRLVQQDALVEVVTEADFLGMSMAINAKARAGPAGT